MFNKKAIYWDVKESKLHAEIEAMKAQMESSITNPIFEQGWGNGYVYIHRDLMDIEDVPKIVDEIPVHYGASFDSWQEDNTYFCVGFDTGHYGDTPETWTKEAVEKETIEWFKNISRYFEVKFGTKARAMLCLHDEIEAISYMAKKRIKGTFSYHLSNSEKYLVKND